MYLKFSNHKNNYPVTADPRKNNTPPKPLKPMKKPNSPHNDPITPQRRDEIFNNSYDYQEDYVSLSSNSVKLIWPVVSIENEQFNYDAVSVYMDHDSRLGVVQDYNCGKQSYDLPDGYNHKGTDIMPWPFTWDLMDKEIITIEKYP